MQKIIKRRARSESNKKDPEKEQLCRSLCSILEEQGIAVRREELRRGHGWQANSGHCHIETQAIVFVDRRLSQDDQISFLVDKTIGFGIVPAPEKLAALPKHISALLQQEKEETVSPHNE